MRAAPRRQRRALLATAIAGFLGGAVFTWILMPRAMSSSEQTNGSAVSRDTAPVVNEPVLSTEPAVIEADPVEDRRRHHLTIPVAGTTREDLHPTFTDARGGNRTHEALDILAPRNTPVIAVEDGRIARLFLSKPGGNTIYQFDPSEAYVYYYAHLERYADGLTEGNAIKRGQVIGYVGTSGNAPADTPHLHFAIFKMTGEKKWWKGTPIDPFPVLR